MGQSNLPSVFVNKVLLEHNCAHLFRFCLWCWNYRLESLWEKQYGLQTSNIYPLALYEKYLPTPDVGHLLKIWNYYFWSVVTNFHNVYIKSHISCLIHFANHLPLKILWCGNVQMRKLMLSISFWLRWTCGRHALKLNQLNSFVPCSVEYK
jgi:hypothetical protein